MEGGSGCARRRRWHLALRGPGATGHSPLSGSASCTRRWAGRELARSGCWTGLGWGPSHSGMGGGGLGVPGVTCPRQRTGQLEPAPRGERRGAGPRAPQTKAPTGPPRPSPSPPAPATPAVTAYLSPAGSRGPRRAWPCLRPTPPRRDPWAPAPRPAALHSPHPASGQARPASSALRPPPVPGRPAPGSGESVRGAQQLRRAQRGAPRSAPARPPREAPPRLPSSFSAPLRPAPPAVPAGAGEGRRLKSASPTPRGRACSGDPGVTCG